MVAYISIVQGQSPGADLPKTSPSAFNLTEKQKKENPFDSLNLLKFIFKIQKADTLMKQRRF